MSFSFTKKYVLRPTFTKEQVDKLDVQTKFSYDLNNKRYLPGKEKS